MPPENLIRDDADECMVKKRPMVEFLTQLLLVIRSWFARRACLEAENLILRQQLVVLRRESPKRVCGTPDRLLLVWLYQLYPSLLDAIIIVQPETIIRVLAVHAPHQRPKLRTNPVDGRRDAGTSGASRRETAAVPTARYKLRRRRPPSQGWKTFLRNHIDGIASLDLFVVRTISFKLLYCLVILRHARRRLASISVTNNPTPSGSQVRWPTPFSGTKRRAT